VGKVLKTTFELTDAVARGATKKYVLFHQRAFAHGAVAGHTDGFGLGWAFGDIDRNDGGNDLSCFFDANKIPYADIFTGDFLKVVKGGTGNG
jgi:hypothetical protein